jgi:diguanylate cyclase
MKSREREQLSATAKIRAAERRDLIAILAAVAIATTLVFFFDTGSLAEWVVKHKETKVDEIITAVFVLSVGLAIFSARRRIELRDQMIRYEALHAELAAASRETALLGELSDLLQSCLTAGEAHKLITDRAQALFPKSSGAVCMTANSRDIVEVAAAWGEPSMADKFFAPKDCWALRRGHLHVMERESNAMYCAHVGEVRPRRALCVPMMAHGEALGLFYLDSGANGAAQGDLAGGHWSEADQMLARTVAERAALALANLQLREILRSQSVRDPLTGLYNRRYMEESLDRELQRAIRKKCPLGVMMIDVDHFKKFNDSFGHEAGDSVLKALGSVFRAQLRSSDIACRYGGEEFAMILPEASLEATRLRAERIREEAKHAISQFRGSPLDTVTLSIGVAGFPEKSGRETLLRAADQALYDAKAQGRDRVVVG